MDPTREIAGRAVIFAFGFLFLYPGCFKTAIVD